MRSFVFRLAGFAGAPVLSALAPFIILPVVTRITGDGWGNFAAGQSIGMLAMVGVLFGWGVVGPVRVARAESAHARAVVLEESVRSRLITGLFAVPLAAAVTFAVCSDVYRMEAVFVAAAVALGGFTPAWFCIGEGNPRGLMIFDAGPKLAASAVSLPVLLVTNEVLWYPVLLVAFTLPAFGIHLVSVRRHMNPSAATPRPTLSVLRSLVPTAAIDAAGNAYGTTAVPIATAGLGAPDASSFASADRAYRVGLLAVIALGNAFQAWVLDPTVEDPRPRHRMAFITLAGLGAVGGAAIALLGPWATALAFGAEVAAAPLVCISFGAAFFFISCGTPLIRNLLIPAGRYRLVLAATVTSALVGVGIMVVAAVSGSSAAIALGVAVAEAVSVGILAFPALATYRGIGAVTQGD